mmetsp:Transcript_4871/g.7988  ORF Transcript_4871/g.7988 Transcript_4871/m.7988 type:complete len:145 (+) Transcript_4871:180-614(+)
MRSVLHKYIYYKSEHRRYANEAAATLQRALPNEIVLKNVLQSKLCISKASRPLPAARRAADGQAAIALELSIENSNQLRALTPLLHGVIEGLGAQGEQIKNLGIQGEHFQEQFREQLSEQRKQISQQMIDQNKQITRQIHRDER